jgi:transposase-like protein
MNDRKTRTPYSKEQKDRVNDLLNQGNMTHNEIVAETGVAKGTVAKMSADLKKGDTSGSPKSAKSSTSPFLTELNAVRVRKKEVDYLLNGKLKQELEELTKKEEALLSLIELYKS